MIMETTKQTIGTFKNTGPLRVTDPCYTRGEALEYVIENAAKGEWEATTYTYDSGSWGLRIAEFEIVRVNAPMHLDEWAKVEEATIGVDSGQAGFFVDSLYPQGETGEFGELDTFYGRACECTCSHEHPERNAGVVAEGAVSRAGYGDGCYELYVRTKGDKVWAAKLVFITAEEEEDG